MAASDWIKMRVSLGTDPAVLGISVRIGIDEFGVIGRLHAVWSWLDCHATDGTNVRIVSAFIDRITGCPGFADALRAEGWLSGEDGKLSFPNYEEHNGITAKRRATEAKRKAGARRLGQMSASERDKCPQVNGTNVRIPPGAEERREELLTKVSSKSRKQKLSDPPSERAMKFAEWFRTTLPETLKPSASWKENWGRAYDEMIRLDNRTPEQIASVCRWARADQHWAKNFQSPLKLRQRDRSGVMYFDVFVETMKSRPKLNGEKRQEERTYDETATL